jgi:anti-sigma regulatory factor (Ser/Thr protein kinase)
MRAYVRPGRRCAARATYTLPSADTSARWARYLTGRYLARGCAYAVSAERIDDARLVVSELITNATRHGGGDCLLRLTVRPGRVTVEVQDGSSVRPELGGNAGMPEQSGPGGLAEGGRGISIVRGLARTLSVVGAPDGAGKTVQAVLAS